MHIILVPGCQATAKTVNLTPRLLLIAATGFAAMCFVMSFLLAWLAVYFGVPFASELATTEPQGQQVQQVQNFKVEEYVRDNVTSMADKLGKMQAELMRLDSLSERISKLSGVNAPKSEARGKDGQGGPLIHLSRPQSVDELQHEIDQLAENVEQRGDTLTALESQLMEQRIKTTLLPTIVPIKAERIGSTFGYRVDPIAGVGAMHEGVDFVADPGTKVFASAGGVVQTAEFHPQYGNLIEIDHGNEFSSRYAHLSKFYVKSGQIVKRGQIIGASGNTGRSTGPHLHFEVRFKGVAQNPSRFLQQGTQLALDTPADLKIATTSGRRVSTSRNSRVTAEFKPAL